MKKTIKRKSTLYTALLISIMSALIISIVSNLLNFNYIKKIAEEDMLRTNKATSELAFSNIDNQFDAALDMMAYITANNSKLERTINEDNANNIISSLNKLTDHVHTSSMISGYDIIFPKSNVMLTHKGNIHYDITEKEVMTFLPWIESFITSGKKALILPNGRYNYPEYNMNITYVAKTPLFTDTVNSISALHIDSSVFKNYIDEENGTFLIFDDDHNLIYQSQNNQDYEEIALEQLASHDLRKNEVESFSVKADRDKLYFCMKHSTKTPSLFYVFIIKASPINQMIPYFQSFVIYAVILIIINLLILSFTTMNNDRIYRRKIRSLVPGITSDKTQDNFDDLSEKLKTEYENLNSSYANAQPILIQNALRMILLGKKHTSAKSIEEMLPYDYISIAVARKHNLKDKDSASHELAEALETNISDSLYHMTTINNETIILLNSSNMDNDIFDRLLDRDPNLFLYRSDIHKVSLEALTTSYNEALKALPYSFLLPDQRYLIFGELNLEDKINKLDMTRELKKMEEALQLHNGPEVAIDILNQLTAELITSNVSIECCRTITRDFVGIFNRNVIDKGIDPVGLFGYDIRIYYEEINDIREYQMWLNVCLSNYFSYMNELRQDNYDNEVKQQIDAILEQSAEKDLTLDYIADKMHIRSDELSRLFKVCYGINYSEYIRDRKMEVAKKLLEEGLLVKQISDELGYSAPQYFIKIFKQTTGITPSQYSKLARNNK